jgi:hypothetical protein
MPPTSRSSTSKDSPRETDRWHPPPIVVVDQPTASSSVLGVKSAHNDETVCPKQTRRSEDALLRHTPKRLIGTTVCMLIACSSVISQAAYAGVLIGD